MEKITYNLRAEQGMPKFQQRNFHIKKQITHKLKAGYSNTTMRELAGKFLVKDTDHILAVHEDTTNPLREKFPINGEGYPLPGSRTRPSEGQQKN
jgi:hypothetical protein